MESDFEKYAYGKGEVPFFRLLPDAEASAETRALFYALPVGEDKAIPRQELATKIGLPDREMRRQIEAARDEGLLICYRPTGGYFLPTRVSEVERTYRMDRARAIKTLKRLKTMRQILKAAGRDV